MSGIFVPKRDLILPRSLRRQRGFFAPAGIGNSGKVGAADFDGTNDLITRSSQLTGVVDSKLGIFSCWIRLDGGDGVEARILRGTTGVFSQFNVMRYSTNKFRVFDVDSTGAVLDIETTTSYTAGATWRHFLSSWDTGTAGARHIYINDVSDLTVTSFTNRVLDLTYSAWTAGADFNGAFKLNGALAELYFAPGQYLDLSTESNRRKFISASGRPVDLGANGSKPTGTAPAVYQRLKKNEAVANFATNRGSGGNFTITGTLDYASSSPSD